MLKVENVSKVRLQAGESHGVLVGGYDRAEQIVYEMAPARLSLAFTTRGLCHRPDACRRQVQVCRVRLRTGQATPSYGRALRPRGMLPARMCLPQRGS
jgi:hypothetical protein